MTDDYLAHWLEKAATDSPQGPEFLRILLGSTVFVIGQIEGEGAALRGQTTLPPGSRVSIQSSETLDGKGFIPFFSSLERLQRFILEQRNYLSFPAKELFEITKGATLVLNPGSSFGREFTPEDVSNLLLHGTDAPVNRRVVEKETQVLLGQPANYPTALVASLSKFLGTRPSVNAAYLAMMHDPSVDEHPHLLLGIETEGDFSQLSREVGVIISATSQTHGPVDVMQLVRTPPGVGQHFLQNTPPFYRRKTH